MDIQRNILNIAQISADTTQLIRAVSQTGPVGVILTGAAPFPELLAWREETQTSAGGGQLSLHPARGQFILIDFKDTYNPRDRHLINLDTGASAMSASPQFRNHPGRLEGYETH